MVVQRRRLTVVDRIIIELRRGGGWSIRMIARELGGSLGTVGDEIRRHGDAAGYRAGNSRDECYGQPPPVRPHGEAGAGGVNGG